MAHLYTVTYSYTTTGVCYMKPFCLAHVYLSCKFKRQSMLRVNFYLSNCKKKQCFNWAIKTFIPICTSPRFNIVKCICARQCTKHPIDGYGFPAGKAIQSSRYKRDIELFSYRYDTFHLAFILRFRSFSQAWYYG